MICSANQMTVSMWTTRLGWNGLNKSESFMIVIIKVNSYSVWTFSGLSKAQSWEGVYKKVYVGVRETKLENRV